MMMSQGGFVITAVCKEPVMSHLAENIKKLESKGYTYERVVTGNASGEEDGYRFNIFCSRSQYVKVLEYLSKYYVKDFGITLYHFEVYFPM